MQSDSIFELDETLEDWKSLPLGQRRVIEQDLEAFPRPLGIRGCLYQNWAQYSVLLALQCIQEHCALTEITGEAKIYPMVYP